MTRDEVIAFAHEAENYRDKLFAFSLDELQRAFEAVAAHEREALLALFPEPHQEYFGCIIHDAIRARATTPKD